MGFWLLLPCPAGFCARPIPTAAAENVAASYQGQVNLEDWTFSAAAATDAALMGHRQAARSSRPFPAAVAMTEATLSRNPIALHDQTFFSAVERAGSAPFHCHPLFIAGPIFVSAEIVAFVKFFIHSFYLIYHELSTFVSFLGYSYSKRKVEDVLTNDTRLQTGTGDFFYF